MPASPAKPAETAQNVQEQAPVPDDTAKQVPSEKVAAGKPEGLEEPEEEIVDEPGKTTFDYDPGGRPDPFKSVLVRAVSKNTKFLPPLQQRDISEMKLIAIVWGQMGKRAMLQMPDGKGYSIVEGTKVGTNGGVVRKITPKEVVIRERFTNIFGETQTREVVLELRSAGEETE